MELQMFIGGDWVAAHSGATTLATSPATGEELGTVPAGGRDDARTAIAAARRAAGPWARLSAFDRAALVHKVADAIEGRRDALARTLTLDQGKPLHAEAYDEVDESPPTTGRATSRSAHGPVRTVGWAGSAAPIRWRRSPSCRPSSSAEGREEGRRSCAETVRNRPDPGEWG